MSETLIQVEPRNADANQWQLAEAREVIPAANGSGINNSSRIELIVGARIYAGISIETMIKVKLGNIGRQE
jgi:hypothetical protein